MRTYAGYPIQLYWQDLKVLETALAELRPQLIIELGTGTGASGLFFSLHAQTISFDVIDKRLEPLKEINDLEFKKIDIFSDFGYNQLDYYIKHFRPIFLFCDNGDKPREFREFAPMLDPGDYIAVHDFGNEITFEQINETVKANCLEPIFENLSVSENSLVRVFKKGGYDGS